MNKRQSKKNIEGRKAAAALRYKMDEDVAPKLVAKGTGRIAEKIIETAREAGVPIYEDPDLIALLLTLNIGEFIPPELYISIAEVLAFIYRLNKKSFESVY
ncbi:MAG: EscU/YscU/HrcU family type III secretion system export apparatus switch protein [Candidatus Latescibacteria bacterium]|nr:EscU/YscU/HrcU family type III secretion system export apparatus switch protein [Candidatus Latescibacterota bacterium]